MNTATISLPKTEYERLKRYADAYQALTGRLFEAVVKDPVSDVVKDFRATHIYTEAFLQDLEEGLRKSSYPLNMQDIDMQHIIL